MTEENKSIDQIILQLKERAKELSCIYTIEDTLNKSDITLRQAFHAVIDSLTEAFQYPHICKVRVFYGDVIYQSNSFQESEWSVASDILVKGNKVGTIIVYYTEKMPELDFGPFQNEEVKLLKAVSDRLGYFILHQKLKSVFDELKISHGTIDGNRQVEWRIILDMLRKTDPNLFMSILRKLLHLLCWTGVDEAQDLMRTTNFSRRSGSEEEQHYDDNKPLKVNKIANYDIYIETILRIASENLSDDVIFSKIQKWIQEDKSSALVKVVESQDTSLTDIADAIRKYYHLAPEKFELSPSTIKGLRVSLLRRFFTDRLEFIGVAKEYVKLTDFYRMIDKMIFPPASHGKLGGKSAGLFLAYHILQKEAELNPFLRDIKIPKTWYLTSDGIHHFMQYNNLEEVLEQKYKEIEEIRIEYPHLVQLFKNSEFPPDIVKGLSVALDDLGERPLVVRSSSLLEDQVGAAFSGKYKSLFLANQGSKQQRLSALMDAIAEVYASTFSPDPIEYRAERGLLDIHEEMGIMIQEVVGDRVGKYYFPAFAGVAFSNNEFRWSPRIRREDGLIRIVPGLGTRAVDRLSDDYPILISPGQPKLKINITPEELRRYSPHKIDVINLETNEFETISLDELLFEYGNYYPMFGQIFSVLEGSMLRMPNFMDIDNENKELIATFDGLAQKSNFLQRIETILKTLQNKIKSPVDVEFACDGKDFYLLQCRPQSFMGESSSDPIPKDIPEERVVFTANRFVSNGKVPEITYIVYVDPLKYTELSDKNKMLMVGRAVGRLNKLLPKRKFILMGPGRWGSRGDIKLGVNVTYSDINNSAMLIEIAKKKGNYVPDLSFGTHFFQDLVEAKIRYLPLYPDDPGIFFNEKYLLSSKNNLPELLSEFAYLEDVIKVIDVPQSSKGSVLKIFMNSDFDTAVGALIIPSGETTHEFEAREMTEINMADYWVWRFKMAEKIASEVDSERFGVKGVYLFGSTKNSTSGPGSDIDLIVHIDTEKCNKIVLNHWFEGWGLALSEMNYLKTGYRADNLLDIHYITDEDVRNKSDYAQKIFSSTDNARQLKMKEK